MTIDDFIAPAFIFVMGMMLLVAFEKRRKETGLGKALIYVLTRYIALLAFGILAVSVEKRKVVFYQDRGLVVMVWDTLPSIALSGLLTLFLSFILPEWKYFRLKNYSFYLPLRVVFGEYFYFYFILFYFILFLFLFLFLFIFFFILFFLFLFYFYFI